MNRLPPEFISLDNSMEDFMAEYKRKTTRIVTAEEIPEGHYWEPVPPAPEKDKPWKLKAAIALRLISWFWFEVAKHLGWIG